MTGNAVLPESTGPETVTAAGYSDENDRLWAACGIQGCNVPVEGKSKWHHQVFQDSFLLKRWACAA